MFDIRNEEKINEIMLKHKLLFECAQDSVLYIRGDSSIVDANEAACRMYGYEHEELINLSIHDIRHSSTRHQYDEQMRQADEHGIIFESLHVRKDGSFIPVEVSSRGTMIGNTRVRIHIIRDITERKMNEDKIIYLANHDSLTGIPNRAYLIRELDKALEMAERGHYKLALLLFDIDKFKLINDLHGHLAGDIVLQMIANRVKTVLRNVDIIARLGGDEFVVVLTIINNDNDVLTIIQRMFKEIEEPILFNEANINICISVGISIYPETSSNRESLIKNADEAMYKAKKINGNSYSF